MAALGAMATGVAHQVASPLGVIIGRVEQLLPKVSGDERAQRAVTAIAEQTQAHRGHRPRVPRRSPAAVRRPSSTWNRGAAREGGRRVRRAPLRAVVGAPRDGHGGPAAPIACDPRLVEQAIVNLLLNACDACEGGGSVELSVQRDGGRVTFSVTDDGVRDHRRSRGARDRAFFTTKPRGPRVGLGLAIASEIVTHHHGALTVAPRGDGRGTTACIRFKSLEERSHA